MEVMGRIVRKRETAGGEGGVRRRGTCTCTCIHV